MGNFGLQTQRILCLRKCCRYAVLRNRDFCVSKIVGEIKDVKSGKLFLKHKIFPAAYLSRVHTVRKNQERKYAFKGSQEKS